MIPTDPEFISGYPPVAAIGQSSQVNSSDTVSSSIVPRGKYLCRGYQVHHDRDKQVLFCQCLQGQAVMVHCPSKMHQEWREDTQNRAK